MEHLRSELCERGIGYLTAALGLVVGLAWNDATNARIEFPFKFPRNTMLVKFLYATVMTVVLVVVTSAILRVLRKEQ